VLRFLEKKRIATKLGRQSFSVYLSQTDATTNLVTFISSATSLSA
jgi:hypothetical protein